MAECRMPRCAREVEAPTITCPSCVGRARTALRAVVRDSGPALLAQALTRGISSTAAMLIGPAGQPRVFGYRISAALNGKACRCTPRQDDVDHLLRCPGALTYLEDCRDEAHPAYVLGSWDLEVCRYYGHQRGLPPTIGSAASYLDLHLSELAQDEGFAFDELEADLARCQFHLQAVLGDNRPDDGVPCPACTTEDEPGPRLRKVYAPFTTCPWPRPANWVPSFDDRWACPGCGNHWTEEEYARRLDQGFLANSDRLTRPDIERAYRVNRSTVTTWANRGQVRRRGRDSSGRTLYDVSDVLRMRDRHSEEEMA